MNTKNAPRASLGTLLLQPLRLVPPPLLGFGLLKVLNTALQPLIAQGELDFLKGRTLAVAVDDLHLGWAFTLADSGLRLASRHSADVQISGASRDLLLLAARREDPDTFFFQRRLRIEGDTELGLQVKNVMDSLDLDELLPPLRWGLQRAADLANRLG
jgi:O2-independent ubiquinone biosynthesis accessory factor UbiT